MAVFYIVVALIVLYFQAFFSGLTAEGIWTIGLCLFLLILFICIITKSNDPETNGLKIYAATAIPAFVMTSCLVFREICNAKGFDIILGLFVGFPIMWPMASLWYLFPLCIDISEYKNKTSWTIMATSMAAIYFLTISKYFM